MKPIQLVYLLLAGAGAILTWYYNLQFSMVTEGFFDLGEFISGGMANPAAASLTMDITIAAMTGFVWIIIEARRLKMRHSWLYILLGGTIAFAFAFPLFLFMRERKLSAPGNA